MASIIIFGTLLGVYLSEWKGVSIRTHRLMLLGLVVLVSSTLFIGYGTYLGKKNDTPGKSSTGKEAPNISATPEARRR